MGALAAPRFAMATFAGSRVMKTKIAGMTIAAAFAALMASSPSFGQGMTAPGSGSPPPAAAPAPSAPPISAPGVGGGARQGSAPRGNPGGMVGGGGHPNRQAWNGRHHYRGGYRGGYGGGIYFGGGPYWGDAYGYDDYIDAPVAVGGDVAYCMRRFKSYDPRSGTYLGFDGLRHPCP